MHAMERSGLFVRIPAAQAVKLDRAAAKAGMRKQDFVSTLLEAQLTTARTRSASVAALPTTADLSVANDTVLTLDDAAELLRTAHEAILVRVAAGDLPGRKIGNDWRFSRHAIFEWLHGSYSTTRTTGFRRTTA